MRIDSAKTIDFLETAYDGDGTDEEWQSRVLDGVMSIVGAVNGAVCHVDSGIDAEGVFRVHTIDTRTQRGPLARPSAGGPMWAQVPPTILARLFGRSLAMTFRELIGNQSPADIPAWRESWLDPIVDNLGIVARDPTGPGCLVIAATTEPLQIPRREQKLLDRVSYHFSAAVRLRRGHRARWMDDAEVIMSPSGKVLHAQEQAPDKRDALDEARRRRDEARKMKHDPEAALEIWRGLVGGRWSLIDHFDSDGKRFLLAMKNAPVVDRRADLTPRERRVCALAAMGHRDKEIAYMLGLSLASVTAALHRARGKLGVKSRTELATTWRLGQLPERS